MVIKTNIVSIKGQIAYAKEDFLTSQVEKSIPV